MAIYFAVALCALECLSALFGFLLSSAIDLCTPTIDKDFGSFTHMDFLANLLFFGKVPFLIVLLITTTLYGLSGLLIQYFYLLEFTTLLAGWQASIPAIMIAMMLSHILLKYIHQFVAISENHSISHEELVGMSGTLVIGHATHALSAQAKVKDRHGKTHYVMVRTEDDMLQLDAGDHLIITAHQQKFYTANIQHRD
ncbi:YqiJ family protein [Gammaproteobacteria bacterium Comchoano-2]|uniref:YqiJ family protein n=1 Tax=Candidatus Synchoanobacter obligatus TaxID=2919597 RepID=A0ABT1L5U5_9GAMM|nr:YqiJ family protein [Candidatus Synchoanobacter obligatus]